MQNNLKRMIDTIFTRLFKQPGRTQQERDAQQKAYRKALDAARKKYPGGAFPSFDLPTLDIDLQLDL